MQWLSRKCYWAKFGDHWFWTKSRFCFIESIKLILQVKGSDKEVDASLNEHREKRGLKQQKRSTFSILGPSGLTVMSSMGKQFSYLVRKSLYQGTRERSPNVM